MNHVALGVLLTVWALVLGLPDRARAQTAGSSPEQVIRNFYAWYVPTHDTGEDLLETRRTELLRYVSRGFLKRIDRLRSYSGGLEADPFLEAQDSDAEWGKRINVRNVKTSGTKTTADVLLMSKAMGTQKLRVTLVREDETWKFDRGERSE